MKPNTESESPRPARKPAVAGRPRVSLFIATACGLGYLPKAPGTWGSLAGVALYWGFHPQRWNNPIDLYFHHTYFVVAPLHIDLLLALCLAIIGIWASGRVARHVGAKDPQFVVIDEVSGQHLTYLLALALLNWKYLLLGFILFRVFDIWKPFPARQAESLPGGWGIMADDWVAAMYAALGLWLARAVGL
jgi:phosphatidylglycerophosphatase A